MDYWDQQTYDQIFEGLEKALKAQNMGRNRECFPLVSFGWKDADLDPEGCTGIKRISNITEEKVSFIIGGHKTFCPYEEYHPTDEEQEIIFDIGYPGDWSGDDWCLYMDDKEVSTPIIYNKETGEVDYGQTAQHMILEAQVKLADFQVTMRQASDDFESLHREWEP